MKVNFINIKTNALFKNVSRYYHYNPKAIQVLILIIFFYFIVNLAKGFDGCVYIRGIFRARIALK